MTVKKSTLALATALAACFVGCEWTGSDESDSWSNTYDGMNFSGTYRAVTTATQIVDTTATDTTDLSENSFSTVQESGGTFATGKKVASGKTSYANVVPGSFSATVGDYVWNDNGSGGLVFTDPNTGVSTAAEDANTVEHVVEPYKVGDFDPAKQPYNLKGNNIVAKSVQITVGTFVFKDDGDGKLVLQGGGSSAAGTVDYEAGTVQFTFDGIPPTGAAITAGYKWIEKKGTQQDSEDLSGSGTVLYSSGAWSLQVTPAMKAGGTITVRYSYYVANSASSASYTTINSSTGTEVSAITVSQNGQNLTFTLNNGIVMSGKFTNVQQTGKINEDTSSGYNTYNAQFQVQSKDTRMVGSLNYDLQTGFRMLNGTWTWGKNSYDVQARGPSWKNSVDDSTLSVDTITKAGNSNTKTSGTTYYGTSTNPNANANPYASGSQTTSGVTVQNVNPMSNR